MIDATELLKKSIWAVVGASENQDKYGYKIYKRLKARGYEVYPVNPNYETLLGEKCYPDLKSLPKKPEVVNMVINPKHGIRVISEMIELGIKNVWLQPGTASEELVRLAIDNDIEVFQGCVLVEAR